MISTVTSKGQITIPKEIRTILNIKPSDKIDFILEGDKVVLRPVQTLKDFRGSIKPRGKTDIQAERRRAKAVVSRKVIEEMK